MSTKKELRGIEVDYLMETIRSQNEIIIKQSLLTNKLCDAIAQVTSGKGLDEDFLTFLKEFNDDNNVK